MKKLFMITVGGSIADASVEIHDVRFVLAEKLEETYDYLREVWFGIDSTLHIDSYKIINEIDGYQVTLGEGNSLKLFMVNYGGKNPDTYLEVHRVDFVVAEDMITAKKLAKEKMSNFKFIDHVDQITNVSEVVEGNLELIAGDYAYSDKYDWAGYIVLNGSK